MSRTMLTGEHFMMGNYACVEGALAAGCRFFAGYPITPSSEIAERMSVRLPQVGGHFIEMEDELASMAALVGASCAGVKSMTATSGPGFSLMMENIGLGMITETPCVIVNVQRGGPSTGIPTLVGQGDMMQARWGSHGDYEAIAYVPNSVQEMFDLTVKAFNMAEKFRQPVFVLSDQIIGHMSGVVRIPPAESIAVVDRRLPEVPPSPQFLPYDFSTDFPPMACTGMGYRINVDSLTHDEHGYPYASYDVEARMMKHLVGKIRNHAGEIVETEAYALEDARVVVVAYGCTSRSALHAVKEARKHGIKAGLLRLITAWPFPEAHIAELSRRIDAFVVPEINYGQMIHPVREFAHCRVVGLEHAPGSMPGPEKIQEVIKGVSQ